MSWANPLALGLLLLAVLLLLVRWRQPRRRIAVGNLYLWAATATHQTTAMSRRWRRHSSLLMQVAVVVTLAAAIARPLVELPEEHIAVVLDTSMSMAARYGEGSRLDAAKARIRERLEALGFGSRVRLWLAGATLRDAGEFAYDDSRLVSLLGQVEADGGAAALDEAIRQATHAEPAPDRVLVLADSPPQAPTRAVEWIAIGDAAPNVAIAELTAHRRVTDPGNVDVLLRVSNFGSAVAVRELVLELGTETLHRQMLEVPARRNTELMLPVGNIAGVLIARLLPADALPPDDERGTIIAPRQPLRIRLVNGSQYVRAALAARRDVAVIADGGADTNAVDLIVCDGCRGLPAESAIVGVLMIPPALETGAPHSLVWHGRPHPVLDGLTTPSALVVPVASSRPIDPQSILASAGDLPVLAAYERDGQRVVELRLDLPRSGLTFDPTFPMLVANALDWLAAAHRNRTVLPAGEPLQWTLRDTAHGFSLFIGPDGGQRPLLMRGGTLLSGATASPGVYHIRSATRDDPVIVNAVTEGESDLSSVAELASMSSPASNRVQEQRTDLFHALLLAAIALLAVEWRQRVQLGGEA